MEVLKNNFRRVVVTVQDVFSLLGIMFFAVYILILQAYGIGVTWLNYSLLAVTLLFALFFIIKIFVLNRRAASVQSSQKLKLAYRLAKYFLKLLLLVILRVTGLEVPEIILWNVFILCVMMYLAQGLGIFQSFLARPSTPPFLKLLILIAFCFLLFSPVINTVLFVGLVLLGIAENWVAFRMPKTNGPPSTPEVE